MAITVPTPGGDAVPGGYPAPTPHLAVVDQDPYVAPTSLPSTNAPAPTTAAFDVIEAGLGDATSL